MNKPIVMAVAALAVVLSMAASSQAYVQYGGGSATGATTQGQLDECKTLNIPADQCNDNTILAARKVGIAAAHPSTGSGTSMLTSETGTMVAFIAILGVVFGGVAAAFFLKGRGIKNTAP